jgi:hypothetical protein
MEIRKLFVEFLVATGPVVMTYFVGWGYLYFFFGAFGINIAEINTDTATIFVYSFPVFRNIVTLRAFSDIDLAWVLLVLIFAFGLLVLLRACYFGDAGIYRVKPNPNPVEMVWDVAYRLGRKWVGIRYVAAACLLILSVFVTVLLIEKAAYLAADQVWGVRATFVVAASGAKNNFPEYRSQYEACLKAQALRLIYADNQGYYLLCMNDDASTEGTVFEVSRTNGLVSARFAGRGGELWPNLKTRN